MTDGTPKDETDTKEYGRLWSIVGSVNVWLVHSLAAMVTVTVVGVLFATGATASTEQYEMYDMVLQADGDEEGFMCNAADDPTFLGEILNTLLAFILVSSIPVFIILYQLDGLIELFALGADTKAKVKKHQRSLWMGAAKIYLTPAFIYLVVGVLPGMGIPECINIRFW